MTHYLLWQSGPRGPSPAILHNRTSPALNEAERWSKLCAPVALAPGEETLSLAELALRYPAPTLHREET